MRPVKKEINCLVERMEIEQSKIKKVRTGKKNLRKYRLILHKGRRKKLFIKYN